MSLTITPAGSAGSGDSGVAPAAPGRLGVPVSASAALAYLTDLLGWRDRRKADLDALDAAALASPDPSAYTPDLVVSLALWKAIADRYELLEVTFDSGRVGPTQAERLSTLIWGRLDVNPGGAAPGSSGAAASTAGTLAVSLPEACRLSDAMTASLRARLSLEPSEAEAGARLKVVREGIERIRDQIGLVPAGASRDDARGTMTHLEQRTVDITDRAKRGADVGGLLAPLEADTAALERDLIVASAQRLTDERDLERARRLQTELAARGDAIRALETQCVAAVTPAPTLAIPDVRALGPVPTAPAQVGAYLRRLDAVSRALDRAHEAYAAALAAREEAIGLAGALQAQGQAMRLPAPHVADLAAIADRLQDALGQAPNDLARVRALLAAYQGFIATATTPPSASTGTRKATR